MVPVLLQSCVVIRGWDAPVCTGSKRLVPLGAVSPRTAAWLHAVAPDQAPFHGWVPRRRYFPTLLIVLLAVFNDGAMIALSKDRVTPSRTPNRWDLPAIFGQGASCFINLPIYVCACASLWRIVPAHEAIGRRGILHSCMRTLWRSLAS